MSRQKSSIDVGALRLGSRVSNVADPMTFGGLDGTPTNGNARVRPTASGRAAWSAVVATKRAPNKLLWFACSAARRLGSKLEAT